jgi:hypothetical protein
MRTMSLRRVGTIGSVGAAVAILVAGCGGAATSASPSTAPAAAATASPTATAEATAAPTAAPTPTAAATATVPPIVTAPPAATVSPTATAAATAAATASPSLAPTGTATLDAPATVEGGAEFAISWTGPDAPGDYVALMASGALRWTNEPYFYTTNGNPGKLLAPIPTGAYELWYVTGTTSTTMVRRPITVTPLEITLKAPTAVTKGRAFKVTWTGPNGPGDYLTIVPAGSPAGTYLSYAYTANGSPATLTAPAKPGKYEIWYASDRVKGILKSRPIVVR